MLSAVCVADAQPLTLEVFGGTAWNLPTRLKVVQPGESNITFKAKYSTRPWKGAPYYAVRVGYDQWSAELIHHKIYLENRPPDIEHFEVSHGYNLAMVSRNIAFERETSLFRIGAGMVIGHPEGRIRGANINSAKSFLGGGYHLSGTCLQIAVGRALNVTDHWFIRPEAKVTAAWARMPLLSGGTVTVPNIALHALIGLGYSRDVE